MGFPKPPILMLLLLAVIVVVVNANIVNDANRIRTPGSKAVNRRLLSDNNSQKDDMLFRPAVQSIMQLLLNNPVNYYSNKNDVKRAEDSLTVKGAHSKKYYGPYPKIWTEDQCKAIFGILVGKLLSECMNRCDNEDGCTAINFNLKRSQCSMRMCTSPVPQPLDDVSDWVGYAIPPSNVDRYFGPVDQIWSDNQCNKIGNHQGKSLAECMDLCDTTSDCSAINFGAGRCDLRACEYPLPKPTWNSSSFVGYGKLYARIHELNLTK